MANPAEVSAVLHVPVAELLDPAIFREERWTFPWAEDRPIFFFELVGDTVWGATGAMLRQLLGLVTGTARAAASSTTSDRMAAVTAAFSNRVTELLGVDIPIVQAPMGWIARAQLASAVSNAGAHGDHRDVVGRARRRSATRSARCATSPTSPSA